MVAFPSIENVQDILEDLAEEIPEPFYEELNLGIVLSPDTKLHPEGHGDLFVLGEYSVDMAGSCITIYYGSFKEVFAHSSQKKIRKELDDTLRHEFWHHLEHRAGERGLERQDEEELEEYLHQHTSKKEGV